MSLESKRRRLGRLRLLAATVGCLRPVCVYLIPYTVEHMTTEEAPSDAEHPQEEAPETEVDRLMQISRKLTAWENVQPMTKPEEK